MTFRNCVFEGSITAEDGAQLTLEDCLIYGAIAYNNARTLLSNVTFSLLQGSSTTIETNVLESARVGDPYEQTIEIPGAMTRTSGGQPVAPVSVSAVSYADGIEAGEPSLDADGSYLVVSGTPERAGEQAIVLSAEYRFGSDGFNLVVPFYLTVEDAPPAEDPEPGAPDSIDPADDDDPATDDAAADGAASDEPAVEPETAQDGQGAEAGAKAAQEQSSSVKQASASKALPQTGDAAGFSVAAAFAGLLASVAATMGALRRRLQR